MQNKFLYQILCLSVASLMATTTFAQEVDSVVPLIAVDNSTEKAEVMPAPTDDTMPDLTGRQAVDFPARTSLDSLELAPLPGIYETNFTGPAQFAPSVSAKDLPSERLLGRLTPEVFQEMAEMERQNTFLKLQLQKEQAKKALEDARALYRQARLDEIEKRENVVRTRIQWWQEQEKIRQDMEAQRLAAENLKNEQEEQKAEQILSTKTDDIPDEIQDQLQQEVAANFALLNIVGINGVLNAKIKNVETGHWAIIHVGDVLVDGSKVKDILPTMVILTKDNKDTSLTFEDK